MSSAKRKPLNGRRLTEGVFRNIGANEHNLLLDLNLRQRQQHLALVFAIKLCLRTERDPSKPEMRKGQFLT